MQTFDLTHWIGARPLDFMQKHIIYCNDCNEEEHERFVVNCQVKFKTSYRTKSLFDKVKKPKPVLRVIK